jgi:LysM repeat protein
MNSSQPSPFQTITPQPQPSRRARVKFAVFSVIALNVVFCMALLLTQGCKRDTSNDQPPVDTLLMDTNMTVLNDTNVIVDPLLNNTNFSTVVDSAHTNVVGGTDPYAQPVAPVTPVAPSTYTIKAGDTFEGIAKANGTTTAAIIAANPTVDPRRLKINSTINLPAPSSTVGGAAVSLPEVSSESVYVVKSGDTLSGIASKHGTSVKAIKSLNNLKTDRITVNQKLKIPVKAPAPVPPALEPAPGAELPPISPTPTR